MYTVAKADSRACCNDILSKLLPVCSATVFIATMFHSVRAETCNGNSLGVHLLHLML